MPAYGGLRPAILNQGDVLKDVPFLVRHGEDVDVWRDYPLVGMVTAHSCEYTKYAEARRQGLTTLEAEVWPMAVAPMYSLTTLKPALQGLARQGKLYRYFPIPAEGAEQEMVVDLAFEQPLPIVVLERLKVFGRLSNEFCDRLVAQMILFTTRIPPSAMQPASGGGPA